MLSLVQQDATQLDEARALLHIVETTRSLLWPLVAFVVLPLAGAVLMLGGAPGGVFLIGAAASLALCQHGPHWWPGRR